MAVSQTEKEMRWVINDKEDTVAETISELKAEHPEKTFVVGDPQETRMFRLDVMKRIGLVGIYELAQKQ